MGNKILICKELEEYTDVTKFVNKHKIKKTDIQQIVNGKYDLYLYYWLEVAENKTNGK